MTPEQMSKLCLKTFVEILLCVVDLDVSRSPATREIKCSSDANGFSYFFNTSMHFKFLYSLKIGSFKSVALVMYVSLLLISKFAADVPKKSLNISANSLYQAYCNMSSYIS